MAAHLLLAMVDGHYHQGVATSRGLGAARALLVSPLPSLETLLHTTLNSSSSGGGRRPRALEIGCGEGHLLMEAQLMSQHSQWHCLNKQGWGSGWGAGAGDGAMRSNGTEGLLAMARHFELPVDAARTRLPSRTRGAP